MESLLGRYSESLYALMRLIVGTLFACHGAQKLFGWLGGFGGQPGATAPLASLMGLAGLIELVGGILVAFGFLTRPLALVCAVEMVVAYLMAHAPNGPWPLLNGGELALLYAFVFLYVAARGGGLVSVDAALTRARTHSIPLSPTPV